MNESEQTLLFENFTKIGFDGLQLMPGQYAAYLDNSEAFKEKWGHIRCVNFGLISAGTLDEIGQCALRRVIKFASSVEAERVVFWVRERSIFGGSPKQLRRLNIMVGFVLMRRVVLAFLTVWRSATCLFSAYSLTSK